MAIVQLIAPTLSQATSAPFSVTGPFVLYGELFLIGEAAILEQEVTSSVWRRVTDQNGGIGVTNQPNTLYWDSVGTFRVVKEATQGLASVSYEVQ